MKTVHSDSCKCAHCAKLRVTRTIAFLEQQAVYMRQAAPSSVYIEQRADVMTQVASWLRRDLCMPTRPGACVHCWREPSHGFELCNACTLEKHAHSEAV